MAIGEVRDRPPAGIGFFVDGGEQRRLAHEQGLVAIAGELLHPDPTRQFSMSIRPEELEVVDDEVQSTCCACIVPNYSPDE
jgi:hypothetical protein